MLKSGYLTDAWGHLCLSLGLLLGLKHKLCFRDWLFLGEIQKMAGLVVSIVRVELVMGAP
jgi:hypothetical protein